MDLISPKQVSPFKHDAVDHGFFGARGGVSTGLYSSLNVGLGSGDDPDDVARNRALVAEAMGVEPNDLVTVYQVHGKTCVYLEVPYDQDQRPKADAMVTDKPGLALGILTADCAPVLFHGEKADGRVVIGAAHAGWRGALAGVLQETVRVMVQQGAVLESIKAAIGPCIQKKSYEVSADFYEEFVQQDPEHDRFFSAGSRAEHPHFDLPGYCAAMLAGVGVKHVYIDGADTYEAAQKGDSFSCRLATHQNAGDYGRQMSVIVISR